MTNMEDEGGHPGALSQVHRYTRASLGLAAVVLGVVCLVTLAVADAAVGHRLVLAVGAVVVTAARTRWLWGALARDGHPPPVPMWRQVGAMAVAVLTWTHAAHVGVPGAVAWALVPGAMLSAIVALQPMVRWWRSAVTGAGAATLSAVGLLALAGVDSAVVRQTGLSGLVIMLVVVAMELAQVWHNDLVVKLYEARRTEAALAVAQERLRFAADLHDTQGHHLEVIALKGELAERLVESDPVAARQQARDAVALARQALAETRSLVVGYRQTSLRLEVDNAVKILSAASVNATVDGDFDLVPHELQPLLAALVREGTTNMLRHSDARCCQIALSLTADELSLRLVNDRPMADSGTAGGSGLIGLHERFHDAGGAVTAARESGSFAVVGTLPLHTRALAP